MTDSANTGNVDPAAEAMWRETLVHGHRHRLAFLPGTMRCTGCGVPLDGLGGSIARMASHVQQSRKNPNFCNFCDDILPQGGAKVDVATLFADLRGSTGIAEKLGPTAFAALLNRFYAAASQALLPRNTMIDKMVGDEVVAMYFPSTGPDDRANAVHSAVHLMRLLGCGAASGPWLPVGIGVNAGTAFCGKVGGGAVHDFTALG